MTDARLLEAVSRYGSPLYAYDLDAIAARFDRLNRHFGRHFGVSYAIKANPNLHLLKAMRPRLDSFDASSIAEVEQALAAGMEPARITFSGPAKREAEVRRAVQLGIGELVLESLAEAHVASAAARAAGGVQPVLVRLNPVHIPRRMGASMGGTISQFGIDEEVMEPALREIAGLPGLELTGFHVYSGSNCLDHTALTENFAIMTDLMVRAQAATGCIPRALIFGSGFGVPYLPTDTPLDDEALAAAVLPMIDALKARPAFAAARCTLEMGRWLVGEAGWLLATVIAAKSSRGAEIRLLDAGFNAGLAPWGMMGSVIRRNWKVRNLSSPGGAPARYTLVGPLCTSIDRLASDIELPELRVGDVIAIAGCGAYGLTASPVRFISHPEPREVAFDAAGLRDISAGWPVALPPAIPVPAGQALPA